MITIYLRDDSGCFTQAMEVDPNGPVPRGTVTVAPPELTGSEVAQWDGENWIVAASRPPEWIEPQIAAAVAQTYTDVDRVYQAAIGLRATEYSEAEVAARAYAAAGYTGPVSPYISGHATHNPTGQAQTNAWSADLIIARADAFLAAQLAMRNTRFACQTQMRAATTQAQLAVAVAIWNQFIAAVFSQLGL